MLWWVSLWTVHSAKEMPAAFIGAHELPGDGGQIQSIRQILVDIEEHYVVEALLGHSRSQVDVDGLKWNLQKHRIPGFTLYIKGLELALNF